MEMQGSKHEPSLTAISEQLERILSSPAFKASKRRKHLLRYIVEAAFSDRVDRLNSHDIAVEVLGRGSEFDPSLDPMVRVEIGRLRQNLDNYYGIASGDPVRIEVPKGGCTPRFTSMQPKSQNETAEGEPLFEKEAVGPAVGGSGKNKRLKIWQVAMGLAIVLTVVLAVSRWNLENWFSDSNAVVRDDPAITLSDGPSVLVSVFQAQSDDPDYRTLARGITEQVVIDLARFRDLGVLFLNDSPGKTGQSLELADMRQRYGADYFLGGSVDRSADTVRVVVYLMDARSARIAWAETYTRELEAEQLFDLQQQIAIQVATAIGSAYGIIVNTNQTQAVTSPLKSMGAYACIALYYQHTVLLKKDSHLRVRTCLEQSIENNPNHAGTWAALAQIYGHEHRFGFNPRPDRYDSRIESLEAAHRGFKLNPLDPIVNLALSVARFDVDDLPGFRDAGQRAIELNPNSPYVLANYGFRLAFTGDWQKGIQLVEKAAALNPNDPDWYRIVMAHNLYENGQYEDALAQMNKVDLPHYFWSQMVRAMILGQLGQDKEASVAVETLLRLRPDIGTEFWEIGRNWHFQDAAIEHMADGLRKAGLKL